MERSERFTYDDFVINWKFFCLADSYGGGPSGLERLALGAISLNLGIARARLGYDSPKQIDLTNPHPRSSILILLCY